MRRQDFEKKGPWWALWFVTLVALCALVLILFLVDPTVASVAQITLFYISLFAWFMGAGALIFIAVSSRLKHPLSFGKAVGLGALTATLSFSAALLQETRGLNLFTFGGIVIALILSFALLKKKLR